MISRQPEVNKKTLVLGILDGSYDKTAATCAWGPEDCLKQTPPNKTDGGES